MTTLSAERLERDVAGLGLEMTAESSTLLRYALLPDPNPMRVSAQSARLTLVISNPGALVTCTRIDVTLPVGTTAKSLISSGGFQTRAPDGWSAGGSGGTITLTPTTAAAGEIGRTGIVLEISALAINAEPGTALVAIDETASRQGAPAATRDGAIEVPRFPGQFHLGPLLAEPLEVPYDGSALLSWSGSPADYALRYTSASGSETHEGLPPVGSHNATHLVSFPCVFTLVVKVSVAGLDTPLKLQRQVSVNAAPRLAITRFDGSAAQLSGNAPITFRWQTQFAKSCALRIARGEGSVDVTAVRSCTLTPRAGDGRRFDVTAPDGRSLGTLALPPAPEGSVTFVLSATGNDDSIVQATFDVVIRPVTIDVFTASFHGFAYSMKWLVSNSVGDVELKPRGTVDPGGPKGGYELVQGGDYTLIANGYWGPVSRTLHLN